MPQSTFDPARSVTFDLATGSVHLAAGEPQVLVSASVVSALAGSTAHARRLGRIIGSEIAGRAGLRQAASVASLRALSLGEAVDLIGGEFALLGLGNLRAERWGDALLFAIDPCALDERGDELVAGIVEGAVSIAAGRELAAAVIEREERTIRVLVCNESAKEKAEDLRVEGLPFTEIVYRLQEGK